MAALPQPTTPQRAAEAKSPQQRYRLLWIVNLDPGKGEHCGAGMRFINFARELTRSGVAVFFAVNCWHGHDIRKIQDFLSSLRAQKVIENFLILQYSYPHWKGTLGSLAFHPALTDRVLKGVRGPALDSLRTFVKTNDINICIASDRMLLFAGAALLDRMPVVFDWTDSFFLYYLRALGNRVRRREFTGLLAFFRDFQNNVIAEAYYGRRGVFNVVVSPTDQKWLGRVNFLPAKNRLVLNGVKTPVRAACPKISKRLIFSGAMDFAPNYEAALWFVDETFPKVLRKHPDAHLVLAGMNPVPQLAQRQSERVRLTGFVPDLGAEIACSSLYVAPLISGSGFKNKVLEALVNGTYVVGTPMSVEFLDPKIQQLLTVARNAQEMATAINDFLDDPSRFDSRLTEVQQLITESFSWADRAQDLLKVVSDAHSLYFNQSSPSNNWATAT